MSADCEAFKDKAVRQILGDLDKQGRLELEEHVESCSACAAYITMLREQDSMLREYDRALEEGRVVGEQEIVELLQSDSVIQSRRGMARAADIWRRRIVRLGAPLAAAAIILIIAVWPHGGITTRVYGLDDVHEVLNDATTIHLRLWIMGREPNEPRGEPDIDDWIDMEGGRYRKTVIFFGMGQSKGATGQKFNQNYAAFDGTYRMDVSGRSVMYYRLNDFQAKVLFRTESQRSLRMIQTEPESLKNFVKVRQEKIDGVSYDVWESDKPYVNADPNTDMRYTYWVSPSTRHLKRMESRIRGPRTNGRWRIRSEGEVDLDVEAPAGIFGTTAPAGCRERNSKDSPKSEAPRVMTLYREQEDIGAVDIALALPGDVAIVAWHTELALPGGQYAEALKSLSGGAELPAEPFRMEYLLQEDSDADSVRPCAGRHLAWTEKEGNLYQWAIYVLGQDMAASAGRCSHYIRLRWRDGSDSGKRLIRPLPVADHEFDGWVRGAMAEFSDTGRAPEHMTQEYVAELVSRIRQAASGR